MGLIRGEMGDNECNVDFRKQPPAMTTTDQPLKPCQDEPDGPDPDFAGIAARASQAAISRAFESGLSVTYMEGDKVLERFPDGDVRELSEKEIQATLEGRSWP